MDGYLRIAASDLHSLHLRHLLSSEDACIAGAETRGASTVTGYSEWIASWNRQVVTLGWDWEIAQDGSMTILNPGELRTNVLVVSEDQREFDNRGTAALLEFLETQNWRELVRAQLELKAPAGAL